MKFLTVFAVCLLVLHAVFAISTPPQNCILDENNVETCTSSLPSVTAVVRQGMPCEKMDMNCWCMKATEYTNDVRRRHGAKTMLKVGPMKQLENAVRYAGVLGDKGHLEHQNLREAGEEVGCGRFIGGENIAYNYEDGDVAKACVDQWESSPGHLENILRDRFEEVVVGFHYESDGRVYCVQTFAQSEFGTGSPSDPGCEPVTMGSGPEPTKPAPTEPTPTKPAPTEPTPTKPTPTEPAPTEPVPTKPAPTGSCEKMDMKCWCMKAKEYTNDVRRRNGVTKMLEVGPMKQLDNAVRYAGVLGDMGRLEHQNLREAGNEIGCGRFIGGENIAYNYEDGDVAKACVDQWENSPGHLENILRDRFDEVVVGFHYESDGRVYCVQTFAQKSSFGSGSESDSGCEPVSMDMGSEPEPEPEATPADMPPNDSMMGQEMKNESNRCCRCVELGRKCWYSLGRLSGSRCKPGRSANRQPMECKTACCSYCKMYPRSPPCRSRRVMRLCKRL